jgi:hypothetical protein
MRRLLEWGGVAAGAILIAFGVAAIFMGITGRSTVRDSIKQEQIVGSADMTPAAIASEAKQANLPDTIALPTCNVAGKDIGDGTTARCFAEYMRIHTLEATGGYTYSQMGRYKVKPDAPASAIAKGGGTDSAAYALLDAKTNQPVANTARDLWVTETALTTALNTSYMAENLALFGMVVGVALLLSGIGFMILALFGALRPAVLREHAAQRAAGKLAGAN